MIRFFTKAIALFVCFVVLMFASCADISTPSNPSGSRGQSKVVYSKSVSLFATSSLGDVRFSPSAAQRQLLPDSTSGTSYNYYLSYNGTITGEGGQVLSFQADASDDTQGTVNIKMDVDCYEMNLYAVSTANVGTLPTAAGTVLTSSQIATIKQKASLRASSVADLRYANEVFFYLSSNGLSGSGNFAIEIKSAFSVPAGYTVTAGLFDPTTDAIKYPASTPASITVTSNAFDEAALFGSVASPISIPNGNYNLKVIFTNTADTSQQYVYSESIVILANQLTKGAILIPDVINKPPIPPLDFYVVYCEPKANQRVYTAEFSWTDTSNKEESFELDLMFVDDAAGTATFPLLPASDADWAALKATYATNSRKIFDSNYYKVAGNSVIAGTTAWNAGISNVQLLTLTRENIGNFRDSSYDASDPDGEGGNLNTNSSHLCVLLPIDHRFVARLRAVNRAGASEYVYPNITGMIGTTKQTTTKGCTRGDTFTASSGASYSAETTTFRHAFISDSHFFAAPTVAPATPTDGVQTINLFKVQYYLGSGNNFATVDGVSYPDLVSYESQRTAISGGTGGASTTGVTILCPDSVSTNASLGVNTPIKRTKNKAGVSGLTSDTYLQLRKGTTNDYWYAWTQDMLQEGMDYSKVENLYPATDADSDSDTPPIPAVYTGYTDLTLFAYYCPAASLLPPPPNPSVYDIQPTFVKTVAYMSTGKGLVQSLTGLTAIAIGNTIANARLDLWLDDQSVKYDSDSDGTPDTAFLYDSITVSLEKADGTVLRTITKADTSPREISTTQPTNAANFMLDLSSCATGNYTINIECSKGARNSTISQTFSVTQTN